MRAGLFVDSGTERCMARPGRIFGVRPAFCPFLRRVACVIYVVDAESHGFIGPGLLQYV
jgi:hypothetical protein